jgi:hypothetical protein
MMSTLLLHHFTLMITLIIRPKPGTLPTGLEILRDLLWQQDYPDRLQAWLEVEAFLLDEGWSYMLPSEATSETEGHGLAAPGATEPTFFYSTERIETEYQIIEILPQQDI